MTSPTETAVCGDPLRGMFYERVGRYFENEGVSTRGDGECAICGTQLTNVVVSSKIPACRAQRSISQNRGRPAEGQPVAFGVKAKDGSVKNSLNGKGAITLIAPDRTFVACNVMPAMPLPPDMTAIPVVPGVQTTFFREFVENPPKPPFLLVLWDRKSTCPFELTHSLSRVAICGTDTPRYFDLDEVRRTVGLISHLGADAFRKACWLRMRIGRTSDPAQIDANNAELRSLVGGNGMSMADFNRLPTSSDVVYAVALQVAGVQEESETQADDAEEAEAA